MSQHTSSPETIFGRAIDIAAPAERAAFLDQACGHDPELRREVEKLVVDHFRAGQFLEQPAVVIGAGRKRTQPEKRGQIAGRVAVAGRPQAANLRRRFGDWEGDTVVSRHRRGGALTLVERKSRYTLIRKVPNLKARTVRTAARQSLAALPQTLRRTLTFDNGKEFAEHRRLAEQLRLAVYFARPYAAWQRGTNENTNGLLRQFHPKGTDFTTVRP